MAKPLRHYNCEECGGVHSKWVGQCTHCGAWDKVQEVIGSKIKPQKKGSVPTLSLMSLDAPHCVVSRQTTGMGELDRVLGGGLVSGSVILVGGDPGIGKSTLLLQCAAALSVEESCAYISGEEAVDQIRIRATRLGLAQAPVLLASCTDVYEIIGLFAHKSSPRYYILDSIQTMLVEGVEGSIGSPSQIRAATHLIVEAAKQYNKTVFLIGHVTKEGALAGPRLLEHMVDTVLYFEGDRTQQFRLLRAIKNRFGATNEIGVFEMIDEGLKEVVNPSEFFIGTGDSELGGIATFPGIEGTRPLLVEIQALVAKTPFGTPRRTTVGWDYGRLSMVLAVLEARCGYNFSDKDVYLSVAGGLRIQDPGGDLAVAVSLFSAFHNRPLPKKSIFFGELGLSGDVRPVVRELLRVKEARKLGMTVAFVPKGYSMRNKPEIGMEIHEVSSVQELFKSMKAKERK